MFKLAIFTAVLAVAAAFPGGLTGIVLDHGLGPIHAPQIISHAVSHPHVIAQPIAPVVHQVPIVTKTVINTHALPHGLPHGLSLGGHGWL